MRRAVVIGTGMHAAATTIWRETKNMPRGRRFNFSGGKHSRRARAVKWMFSRMVPTVLPVELT